MSLVQRIPGLARRHAQQRSLLAEDVQRAAGYMTAVLATAERLGVPVAPALEQTVDTWRAWQPVVIRQLQDLHD